MASLSPPLQTKMTTMKHLNYHLLLLQQKVVSSTKLSSTLENQENSNKELKLSTTTFEKILKWKKHTSIARGWMWASHINT